MMGTINREIDPETGDYVFDAATGATTTTRNALTVIYHQVKTRLGQWWGDPEAGSRMFELRRAKNLLRTPIIIQDIFSEALTPLVEDGRHTEPEYESERTGDRVTTKVVVTDTQSGDQLQLTELLPFDP
jgi:phage gp46-like protein